MMVDYARKEHENKFAEKISHNAGMRFYTILKDSYLGHIVELLNQYAKAMS